MWITIFFVYTLIFLIISSAISLKLRGVANVRSINYLNDIILLISVALMSATLTMTFTVGEICASTRPFNYVFYAVLVMIILNVALNVLSIMMVSHAEFSNCPSDVKSLIAAALTINLFGTVGGIVYGILQNHNYMMSSKDSLPGYDTITRTPPVPSYISTKR